MQASYILAVVSLRGLGLVQTLITLAKDKTKILKPIQNKTSTSKAPPIGQYSNRADVVCFNCGEPGHTIPICPLKNPKITSLCWVTRPNHSSTYAHNPEPTITVLLNGKPLTSLIDTGCSHTLVRSQYIPRDIWNEDETVNCLCSWR